MACEFPVAVRRVANCYTLFTFYYQGCESPTACAAMRQLSASSVWQHDVNKCPFSNCHFFWCLNNCCRLFWTPYNFAFPFYLRCHFSLPNFPVAQFSAAHFSGCRFYMVFSVFVISDNFVLPFFLPCQFSLPNFPIAQFSGSHFFRCLIFCCPFFRCRYFTH